MNIKKIIGILTIVATLTMLTLVVLLLLQGTIEFKASMVQLAMCNFSVLIGLSGLYLVESHCTPNRISRMSVWGLGVFVMILGTLVSFNLIDYKSSWNFLIAAGVGYITLVQLQLINWDESKSLVKVLGLLLILSNMFIVVYFLAKLSIPDLGIVLDITVITSVFSFLIGMIISNPKKEKAHQ
ncbi:hypothetical protein K6119_05725 [Paracrocinitomix mangrovi]|uniref:hypothetical protein n=1 Tax=Paracrocinitomix mangrovi TaxID=2862509 RepID=UPI001C8E3941|nr:hypothetical protein [Paracrocinitomix mangrovi]UKN03013.1 hypothetical protein K6119_05725 [Paracrocinitomix mangrovi]